jgi:hypothetical protein
MGDVNGAGTELTEARPPAAYQGDIPAGADGERAVRERLRTGVLTTGEDERELGRDEINELLAYLGFAVWDATASAINAARSAGPGPMLRREYEAVGVVQIWQRHPELLRLLTEAIGLDGLHRMGATSRHELGTKVNMAHIWAAGTGLAFGRGIAMGLGQIAGHQREDDLRLGLATMRALGTGLRGGPGRPLFATADGYRAPVLEQAVLDRFQADRVPVEQRHQRFDTETGRLAGLLHVGHHLAHHHTGPYPSDDGGVLIVRDHFPHDELYHWADLAQALFLHPDAPPPALDDTGAVQLRADELAARVTGTAVYARDRWDTPADQIRRLDAAELDELAERAQVASERLAGRFAAMPRRDRIAAGVQVRQAESIVPFARAAGLWDRMRTEFDVFEWDRLTSDSYYAVVTDGGVADLVPRLLVTGGAFAPVKDPISDADAMPALHLLTLRGTERDLPVDPMALESAGLVAAATDGGYQLTEAGRAVHARQLRAESRTYEVARLVQAYERFLSLDQPLETAVADWGAGPADEEERQRLLAELGDIVQRARVALRRTNEQLVRFEPYLPRMRRALARAQGGEPAYIGDLRVDSVYRVWRELHRDYLITQGLERAPEPSH